MVILLGNKMVKQDGTGKKSKEERYKWLTK